MPRHYNIVFRVRFSPAVDCALPVPRRAVRAGNHVSGPLLYGLRLFQHIVLRFYVNSDPQLKRNISQASRRHLFLYKTD